MSLSSIMDIATTGLQTAQYKATSSAGQADASYNLLDQIQSQFGDLTNPNGLFNQATATLNSAAQAAEDPSSAVSRQQVLANMSSFLGEGARIAGKIQDIRTNADTQIAGDVQSVNGLLSNIAKLNTQISLGSVTGGDGTGTWSLDGGTSKGTFSAASFATDLTSAFGGAATVGFSNGALSITASGSGGNNGIAVVDPPAGSANAAASKSGQGFSQFFGLNDLITSSVPTTNQTGLTANSNAGFVGGTINFTPKSPTGALLGNVSFSMPSSGTVSDIVTALNATTNGVGRYGTFSLDSNGALTFKGFGNPANTLSITDDSTARLTSSGPSFSRFFGLGGTASTAAAHLAVNASINNKPSLLSLAKVSLSAPVGQASLLPSDGRGGTLLSNTGNAHITFAKTGMNGGGVSTLATYGADLAGLVGDLSANAKSARDAADSLLTEATSRRSSAEGVNLDEELVNLTTYQQAYSASGRLVQPAKDMFDVLMNIA